MDAIQRTFVLLALIALPFVYFAPAWMGGVALVHGDGLTANLGLRILTGRMIGQGMLPLWNPYIFAGMPLLASIYPGALYPFNWIFALLSPGVAMQLVVITTYHVALIGAYCYARSLGVTRLGSLLTGMIFCLWRVHDHVDWTDLEYRNRSVASLDSAFDRTSLAERVVGLAMAMDSRWFFLYRCSVLWWRTTDHLVCRTLLSSVLPSSGRDFLPCA